MGFGWGKQRNNVQCPAAGSPVCQLAAVSQVAVTRAMAAVSVACSSVWATGTAAVPWSMETSGTAAVSLGTFYKNYYVQFGPWTDAQIR